MGQLFMCGLIKGLVKGAASSRRVLAVGAIATALPLAAHASVIETFEWVPDYEQTGGYSQEPVATLQLTFQSPETFASNGSYWASSGDAMKADITAFSYTGGSQALSINLSNVSGVTVTTTAPWQTSGLVTPAADNGEDGYPAPKNGYYLISAFTLAGTVNGQSFMMATNAGGTAGTTVDTGIPNSDFTYGAGPGAIEEGGYWELVQPVPLPAGLPLLLSGIAGLGVLAHRRKVAPV